MGSSSRAGAYPNSKQF